MSDHSRSEHRVKQASCGDGNKRRWLLTWRGQAAELLTTGCGRWEVTSANEVTG